MRVVTLKEAVKRGWRFYYLGTPCVNGHISRRYASTQWCVECAKEHGKKTHGARVARSKAYRRELKLDALNAYGGACACCGETRCEFLCIDHINGGGRQHREAVSGGWPFYLWLRRQNYPKEYRVLCWNCNAAYGLFGYCPHNVIDNVVESVFKCVAVRT